MEQLRRVLKSSVGPEMRAKIGNFELLSSQHCMNGNEQTLVIFSLLLYWEQVEQKIDHIFFLLAGKLRLFQVVSPWSV